MSPTSTARRSTRVIELRRLSETGYELVLERDGLQFEPGAEVLVHGHYPTFDRTYSIASGTQDPDLRILFRLIPTGRLTPILATLSPGDTVEYTGPHGNFLLRDPLRPVVFVATGTGIAPCASYLRSHPGLKLTVLHGVRTEADLFYSELLAASMYRPCISRNPGSKHHRGRVTDVLADLPLEDNTHVYLCGANPMISDAYVILRQRGVPDDSIFSEPYYFW